MATLKRHRYVSVRAAQLQCEAALWNWVWGHMHVIPLCSHTARFNALKSGLYVCVCVDFQWIVVMYLCLDSCFLAGVTKRLCVCVWARSERSHCAPALIYLRLHEAKTASVISFSHTYNDCSNISIILVPLHQRSQRLGAKLLCFHAAPLKRAICCKAATYRKSAAS